MPAPIKLWSVIRIVDYRMQALACDSDPCWEDISGDTIISQDRERMFNLARECRGLLISSEGIPSARQVDKYRFAVGTTLADAIARASGVPANSTRKPASEPDDDGGLGLPDADFDPKKAAGRSAGALD